MHKRILTIDDLVAFCVHTGFNVFSAKDSGYQLSVQMPEATFEVDDDEEDNDSLWYGTIKAFHVGPNRNHSSVTLEAANKAMPNMKYKPVLAEIAEIADTGEKDFTTHSMEITEDGVNYLEKQVGCFTADEPWISEENGKEYICAKVAISKIYTETVDILKRKNGTKVSVELGINQMSWNAKDKVLLLEDIEVQGVTLLGHLQNGTEVQEGMEGAFLDIQDFSSVNNSVAKFVSAPETMLIETLDRLNESTSNFNIKSTGKEESSVNLDENKEVFEEDIEKEETGEETAEVIETEAADTPDPVEVEKCGDDDDDEDDDDKDFASESEDESEVESEVAEEFEAKFVRTYELSHDDIRCALYQLLAPYEETNNVYYYICNVYDDKFIFSDWCGNYFGCKYNKSDSAVSLDGDIYNLYAEFLTETEKATIDTMRGDYAEVCDKLAKYEAEPQKMEILGQECYASIADTAEFKELKKFDVHFDMSVEDVSAKADAILLDYAKNNQLNFSETETAKAVENKQLPVTKTKKSRYGNIFK